MVSNDSNFFYEEIRKLVFYGFIVGYDNDYLRFKVGLFLYKVKIE